MHRDLPATAEEVRLLPLATIAPSPFNPRRTLQAAALTDLADSIRTSGLQQPIVVRSNASDGEPGYEIVFGHRRCMAAREAGLDAIPAIVRELTDDQVLVAQTIENLQREDLSPLDEARGYRQLLDHLGVSVDQITERVGRSRTQIYARLSLLELAPAAAEAVERGELKAEIAQLLARAPASLQDELLTDVRDNFGREDPMSFRQARDYLSSRTLPLTKAKFEPSFTGYALVKVDGELQGDARALACAACPARSGNRPDMADEDPEICLDTHCYHAKERAESARRYAEFVAAGAKPAKRGSSWEQREKLRQGELIDLGRKDPAIDKKRPLRDVLGGQLAGATLIGEPGSGDIQVAMTPTALATALKKAGIDKASSLVAKAQARQEGDTPGATAGENERWKRQRQAVDAFRTESERQIVNTVALAGPLEGDLLTLARFLSQEHLGNIEQQIFEALGKPMGKKAHVDDHLATLDSTQLARYCTIVVALAGLEAYGDCDGHQAWTTELCGRYGIDLTAIRAQAFGLTVEPDGAATTKRKGKK